LKVDVGASLAKHLHVIKEAYCHCKKVGNFDVWVFIVLLVIALDIEQSTFKLLMKSNVVDAMAKPSDVNHVSCFWYILSTSRVFSCSFPKYFELVKIAMVQVLESVEDERCFNSLTFCKSMLHNRLITNLGLVVKMFSHKFYTLHNFPYVGAFEQW
jgi:hypothetical protein